MSNHIRTFLDIQDQNIIFEDHSVKTINLKAAIVNMQFNVAEASSIHKKNSFIYHTIMGELKGSTTLKY